MNRTSFLTFLRTHIGRIKAVSAVLLVVLSALCVALMVYGNFTGPLRKNCAELQDLKSVQRAKDAGDAWIAALRLHKARYGSYPSTLDQLVPEFIETPPTMPNGLQSYYSRGTSGDSFVIAFGCAGQQGVPYPCFYYDLSSGHWKADV